MYTIHVHVHMYNIQILTGWTIWTWTTNKMTARHYNGQSGHSINQHVCVLSLPPSLSISPPSLSISTSLPPSLPPSLSISPPSLPPSLPLSLPPSLSPSLSISPPSLPLSLPISPPSLPLSLYLSLDGFPVILSKGSELSQSFSSPSSPLVSFEKRLVTNGMLCLLSTIPIEDYTYCTRIQ